MANTTTVLTITLTTEQVRAANSIARNMKRNKSDNAEQLVKKVLNNYLLSNFEHIADAAKDLAAKSYDSAIQYGFKPAQTREEFIASQLKEANDVVAALKAEAKK